MVEELQNTGIEEMYGTIIQSKYKGEYERNRWFSTPRLQLDFQMMFQGISHHVEKFEYLNCLELGPGPGTWTQVLLEKYPSARYHLVDISEKMRDQFVKEGREQENIIYEISDIMQFDHEQNFDFFFSSRAVEYLEDKDTLFAKISSLLVQNAKGCIVTKNPKFSWRHRRTKKRTQHSGQISMKEMSRLLHAHGFSNTKIYPVIVRIPVIDRFSLRLSHLLFLKRYTKTCPSFLSPFVESYIVTFSKS